MQTDNLKVKIVSEISKSLILFNKQYKTLTLILTVMMLCLLWPTRAHICEESENLRTLNLETTLLFMNAIWIVAIVNFVIILNVFIFKYLVLLAKIFNLCFFSKESENLIGTPQTLFSALHRAIINYFIDLSLNIPYCLITLGIISFQIWIINFYFKSLNKSRFLIPLLFNSISIVICIITILKNYDMNIVEWIFSGFDIRKLPFKGIELIMALISFGWSYFLLKEGILIKV